MFKKIGPYWKGIIVTLLPVAQVGFSLYSDGALTTGELKQIGAEALIALGVWFKSAPGYSAPGQVAVPAKTLSPYDRAAGFLVRERDQHGTGFAENETATNYPEQAAPPKRRIKDNPQA